MAAKRYCEDIPRFGRGSFSISEQYSVIRAELYRTFVKENRIE